MISALKAVLGRPISSDRTLGRIAEILCYVAAIVLLAGVGRLIRSFAKTPFEMLAVIFMDVLLALMLILLGMVVSHYARRPKDTDR